MDFVRDPGIFFDEASLHFWKLLMLVAGLFLGPTLSILGEVQKVQKQDHAMRDTRHVRQKTNLIDSN